MAPEDINDTTQSEPQAAETQASAEQGTTAGGEQETVDWQSKVTELESQLAQMKGFQSFYTKAKQSGTWDLAEQFLEQAGGNVSAAKELASKVLATHQTLEEMGGLDTIKKRLQRYEELGGDALYEEPEQFLAEENPSAAVNPTTARPEDWERKFQELTQQLPQLVQKNVEQVLTQREIQETMFDMAAELASEAGFVKDESPDPSAVARFQALLDAEVKALTQGQRQPNAEDIGVAAANVHAQFIVPLKAAGAQTAAKEEPQPEGPPTANTGGPGGQQPAAPLTEMPEEEVMNKANQLAERIFSEAGISSGGAQDTSGYPPGWEFTS